MSQARKRFIDRVEKLARQKLGMETVTEERVRELARQAIREYWLKKRVNRLAGTSK